MRYVLLLAVLLLWSNISTAQAKESIEAPGTITVAPFEYIPVQWNIDRSYIAQTFDPPRIPKVGDRLLWKVYEVNEQGTMYNVKMRLHYVPCEEPVHTYVLPVPPDTNTGITVLDGQNIPVTLK